MRVEIHRGIDEFCEDSSEEFNEIDEMHRLIFQLSQKVVQNYKRLPAIDQIIFSVLGRLDFELSEYERGRISSDLREGDSFMRYAKDTLSGANMRLCKYPYIAKSDTSEEARFIN